MAGQASSLPMSDDDFRQFRPADADFEGRPQLERQEVAPLAKQACLPQRDVGTRLDSVLFRFDAQKLFQLLLLVGIGKLVDFQLQQDFFGDALRHPQRKVPPFHV